MQSTRPEGRARWVASVALAGAMAAARLSCAEPPSQPPFPGTASPLGQPLVPRALLPGPEAPPTPVHPQARVVAIDSDEYGACALIRKSVYCWGDYGRFTGTQESVSAARKVPGIEDAESIAVGGGALSVMRRGGRITCPRSSSEDDIPPADRGIRPEAIAAFPPAKAISLTMRGGCMVAQAGTVQCWGAPNGVLAPEQEVRQIEGIGDAIDVAAGRFFGCALRPEGRVSCWGRNVQSGLDQSHWELETGFAVEQISAYEETVCARGPGKARCIGGHFWGKEERLHDLPGLVSIDPGRMLACAAREDGHVLCFGTGQDGTLGEAGDKSDAPPTEIPQVKDAVEVTVGQNTVCARLRNDSVQCWGDGSHGQLGDGKPLMILDHAEMVPLPAKAVQIVTYRRMACAVLESGALRCWGDLVGPDGAFSPVDPWERAGQSPPGMARPELVQLAFNDTAMCGVTRENKGVCLWDPLLDVTPGAPLVPGAPIAGLETAIQIAHGLQHACALLANGEVRCWGANHFGQLGGRGGDAEKPRKVPGIARAVEIGVSLQHTCARLATGQIECWGGFDGQEEPIADGSKTRWRAPVSDAVALVMGPDRPCAIRRNGEVHCYEKSAAGPALDKHLALYDGASSAASWALTCFVRNGKVACTLPLAVPDASAKSGASAGSDNPPFPVDLFGPTPVRTVAAGEDFACALLEDGRVGCWGAWSRGQLGHGDRPRSLRPVTVVGLPK